ncbi:J domain-containing protein [Azonexus hydrophilus]|uniref:J domain-containing protein n=1 Tax=Azonexus hydrophilus TaxID=418702 RepID=A0ABZ2XJM1_9RHOO
MPSIHSHYENLRIARNAPPAVIRAAYRALAQEYHPDRNHGSTDAARIMVLLNEAYRVLSDDTLRKEHDEWLRQAETALAPEPVSEGNPTSSSSKDNGGASTRATGNPSAAAHTSGHYGETSNSVNSVFGEITSNPKQHLPYLIGLGLLALLLLWGYAG